jgi:hypothetical protein
VTVRTLDWHLLEVFPVHGGFPRTIEDVRLVIPPSVAACHEVTHRHSDVLVRLSRIQTLSHLIFGLLEMPEIEAYTVGNLVREAYPSDE